MMLVLSERAVADIEEIQAWIARERPRSAEVVVEKLLARIRGLLAPGAAHMGRPGRDPGTRELVEPPYIIIYEVNEDAQLITVRAVFHGARDR